MSISRTTEAASPHAADAESSAWLRRLTSGGPDRDEAIAELRALLLRAARSEVRRRRGSVPYLRGGDLEDLVEHAVDDALMAILAKLDDYRGESRFTTWAYKFALLEAAVMLRRCAWQGREIPLEAEAWAVMPDRRRPPDREAEWAELLHAMRDCIDHELSPHQREILVAITLNDVPIDVLAERLNTTRGALYKTLHDARAKLRAGLTARGLDSVAGRGSTHEPS